MSWQKNIKSNLLFSKSIMLIWLLTAIIGVLFKRNSPNSINLKHKLLAPFSSKNDSFHTLGTDELGRDVLSSLLEGSANAFLIGLFSVFIAAIIGIAVGYISAKYQDNILNYNILYIIIRTITLIVFFLYLVVTIPWFNLNYLSPFYHLLLPVSILFVLNYFSKNLNLKSNKKINIPLDLILGRLVEIFESLPTLFILVALSTLISGTWYSIAIIIGLTSWPSIAKFSRAEFIKVKQMDYIEATRALGLSKSVVLLKHYIPNAVSPIVIALAFGIANAVIIESTLAFLGLGINAESASWGNILVSARLNQEAWWLTLFPSLAIFLVVYSCTTIGEKLKF